MFSLHYRFLWMIFHTSRGNSTTQQDRARRGQRVFYGRHQILGKKAQAERSAGKRVGLKKQIKFKFTAKPLLRCILLAHDIHKQGFSKCLLAIGGHGVHSGGHGTPTAGGSSAAEQPLSSAAEFFKGSVRTKQVLRKRSLQGSTRRPMRDGALCCVGQSTAPQPTSRETWCGLRRGLGSTYQLSCIVIEGARSQQIVIAVAEANMSKPLLSCCQRIHH